MQAPCRNFLACYKDAMTTKTEAKKRLGFTSDDQLAAELEMTRQAVNNMPDDKPLKKAHQWMLWGKNPRKFRKPK